MHLRRTTPVMPPQQTSLVRATNPADEFSLTTKKRDHWIELRAKFAYSATYWHKIAGPNGL